MPGTGDQSLSEIKFTSLGSVGEVGASGHLIEIGGLRVLLDCGLHPKEEGKAALPDFSYLEKAPDAVVISHAHVDHCGSVPYLLKNHPSTLPYATPATVRIMDRMLHNSVAVMGKLRAERGIDDYPLYDHGDVETMMRRIYGIDYDQEFALRSDSPVRARFGPAGHVLGSATVHLSAAGHSVFYTSDICTADQELLGGFAPPPDLGEVDTLIIESTYGANEDADRNEYSSEILRFGKAITEVIERGGTVLVPSFALGRAQEILNIVARLQESGMVPEVPVYASGLGRAVYETYLAFSELLRPDAVLRPLGQFDSVGDVWNPSVARRLTQTPSIIVATSGMMIENTPSAMIAREMVGEEQHGIFFVGYCDPDTLGYKVKQAKPGDQLTFASGMEPVEMRLQNIEWFHFSAHAPRSALRRVIDTINAKNVVFVHGDPPALEWMHDNCGNGCAKFTPRIGETIQLKG